MSDLTPGAWFGIALFAAYGIWLWAFFTHVRPRLMRALARRLSLRVRESQDVLDASTWATHDDAPLGKTGAVVAADFAVLMLGTVGVAALVFVPAFIVAESGVLLALEGRMTGRQVMLRVTAPAKMQGGKAALAVEAVNEGRAALRQCRALVELLGAQRLSHGRVAVVRPGRGWTPQYRAGARRHPPPIGEHEIRIKVECANERLAVGDAVVVVR